MALHLRHLALASTMALACTLPQAQTRATAIIWRLLQVAEKRFRKLNAPEPCRDVYRGVRYADGLEVPAVSSTQKAAA
ncbi:hypothetical protein [Gemmatimonas sp.]|uniref:hypothetical protein n=1 Tax=Gemmatimonas sp. TaxID=1962908 RepID=UPI0022C7A85A|nr:hypothetical protein [Gemmatimonas sp.]MCZ8206476.1 hypothetical protein [Gemmatimonas sp.]